MMTVILYINVSIWCNRLQTAYLFRIQCSTLMNSVVQLFWCNYYGHLQIHLLYFHHIPVINLENTVFSTLWICDWSVSKNEWYFRIGSKWTCHFHYSIEILINIYVCIAKNLSLSWEFSYSFELPKSVYVGSRFWTDVVFVLYCASKIKSLI